MTLDACDCCGRRHASNICYECRTRLCDAHHECPECDGELTADHPDPDDRQTPYTR
jgi:hypothetical protein